MKIIGTESLSDQEINLEIQRGGKFVVYQYCISLLIMTFKRSSNIYFIKVGENSIAKGAMYSLISVLIGWWGIPWGPIYTISSIYSNLRGGKDVTSELIENINNPISKESVDM